MNTLAQDLTGQLEWYKQHARPFFEDLRLVSLEKLIEFDKDAERLQHSVGKLDTELVVCFLGNSGVGKSTLLNAIVNGSQPLVPSGGIGPLTAQAVVVQYAEQPRLRVEYHGIGVLQRTIFGLEQMYRTELGEPVANGSAFAELAIDVSDDIEFNVDSDDSDVPSGPQQDMERAEKRKQWRKRAQLLVTGSQDEERSPQYLVDSLREAIGQPRRWGTSPKPEDNRQLYGIQRILKRIQEQPSFSFDTSNHDVFKSALHDHAVGFMAPLIKNLTVYWPSPLLQSGIVLVDLPGVGIAGDEHKEVTRFWIRERAKALVLVVDHRGMTEAVEQSLRRSEFLNNLLYSAEEPDEDPVVIVAVTRVDDTASDYYLKDKSKRKYEHFLAVCNTMDGTMRQSLQQQLNSIWLSSEEITEARKKVATNLLASLQVHPVSAPEYVRLLAQDEDDRSFLQNTEQSGVPAFVNSLKQLALEREQVIHQRVAEKTRLFHESLFAQLQIIEAQWESRSRVKEEAEKLRSELNLFLEPRRKELLLRQGSFYGFLSGEIPQEIRNMVRISRDEASRSIAKYMGKLGNAHWATLRASVTRGGIYAGARDINLPTEFALRFEEPIADAWNKEILRDLRAHTRDYGKDCLALARELTNWAEQRGERGHSQEATRQYEALETNAKKLEVVGKESSREMRDEVRAKLVPIIETRIKHACREFVKRNSHIGPGVKNRILEFYGDLAQEAAEIAEEPARHLLQRVYREAREDIRTAAADFQDPLTSIANAIVATKEQEAERQDAQKRQLVLSGIHSVIDGMPTLSTKSVLN